MTDKVLVSFFNHSRENYNKAALGLIRSFVEIGWDGDYMLRSSDGYIDEYLGVKITNGSYPITKEYGLCYNQAEAPYLFKPYMIQEAFEAGYNKIIWCDSTMRVKKDLKPLWDIAAQRGIVAFDNIGHPLRFWISDVAREHLRITEHQLSAMPQIMACCILFDFSHWLTKHLFGEWITLGRGGACFQNYGSMREGFRGHRHDQAILSGILAKNGIPLEPYGKLVYPPHDIDLLYGDDIFFVNKGIS